MVNLYKFALLNASTPEDHLFFEVIRQDIISNFTTFARDLGIPNPLLRELEKDK
jgi:hypothetical protein